MTRDLVDLIGRKKLKNINESEHLSNQVKIHESSEIERSFGYITSQC